MLNKIRSDYFRAMCYGATGSGKTYWISEILWPKIKDQYDIVIIFTRKENVNRYRTSFKKSKSKSKLYFVTKNFRTSLEGIIEAQSDKKNVVRLNKHGDPVFKNNLLFIWDDIIDEKLFGDSSFMDQFIYCRHLQISVIVLSQICNKAVNTRMKGNACFSTMFRVNGQNQKRVLLNMIGDAVSKGDPGLSEEAVKKKSVVIYNEKLRDKPYGYVIVDKFDDLYDSI